MTHEKQQQVPQDFGCGCIYHNDTYIYIYIILFFKAIPCWGIQSYDFWAIHLRHWRCEVERHWRKGTPQGPAIYAAVSGCLKMPKPRESWEHQQIVTVNKKFPVLSIDVHCLHVFSEKRWGGQLKPSIRQHSEGV